MAIKQQRQLADKLTGESTADYRSKRQWVGLGVVAGFFVALLGYMFTGSGWWFLAPFAGFALLWRVVMERWPFLRD